MPWVSFASAASSTTSGRRATARARPASGSSDLEKRQGVGQGDLGRGNERQSATGAVGLVRVDYPGIAVEGVEGGCQLGRKCGDALGLFCLRCVLDDVG